MHNDDEEICKKCGHKEKYHKPDYDIEGGWDLYICNCGCIHY